MQDKPDFIGHQKFLIGDKNLPHDIKNFIIEPKTASDQWIKFTSERIGDWRASFRSTYIRWALTLNGLHVAEASYRSRTAEPRAFTIEARRSYGMEKIVAWNFSTAAENHKQTIPMIAAWGVIDLYSCLEEFVFEFYKIYLNQYPDSILKGADFRELRKLRAQAADQDGDKEVWKVAWDARLEQWQRKRIYDGLHKVFLAYMNIAGLKTPSSYRLSTIESWSESIKGFAELRNCFTHGVSTVTSELAEFSASPMNMGFDFKLGEKLDIKLRHLQFIECFVDQLLTALNLSLLERAGYALPARG
jgi:hypothetical protein